MVISTIIGLLWIGFVAVWLFAAIAKRHPSANGGLTKGAGIRLLIAVCAIAAIHLTKTDWMASAHAGGAWRWAGLAATAAGIGLAFWARACLAGQWGMPMTRSSRPQLITSGPYRWIRHPIYTGMFLAGFGTCLALSYALFVALAIMTAYFTYAAFEEEKFLTVELGQQYTDFRRQTKMFIPLVY